MKLPLHALRASPLMLLLTLAITELASGQNNTFTIIPGPAPGDTFSTVPFTAGSNSVRFQQVYGSSSFSRIAGPGPFLINNLQFREDELHLNGFHSQFADFQINLSTTTRAVDGLSTTFSANDGADDTVVIGRGVFQLGPSGVGDYDVIINLPTPFYYDPAQGNLLLDIRNFGGGVTTWASGPGPGPFIGPAYVDAASIVGDNVSSVSSGGVAATEGTVSTLGLVTRIEMTVVPEPPVWALFSLGTAGLALVLWRRQTNKSKRHVTT